VSVWRRRGLPGGRLDSCEARAQGGVSRLLLHIPFEKGLFFE
jgi:hypothetical protein